MARMFWQRCPRCGRLTLSRVGAETTCECSRGESAPSPRPQATSTPEATGVSPVLPASTPVPALPPTTTPAPAPAPGQTPALALLTPEQDAAARRLLASVFPNGFDF